MSFFKRGILMLLVVGLLLGLVGCQVDNEGGADVDAGDVKGTINLGYVNWDEAIAMTHLAQVIIEDHLGYEVETTQADVGPIFQGLAKGNFDAFMDSWLPVTHASYFEEFGDEVDLYETVYHNARIGLVVPAYVDIDTIEELNEHQDKFKNQIVGIDAGAGITMSTEEAIDEYGLELELVKSSGPAMTASLASAIDKEEWVVVTGWAPHWKFARWDIKFLEDPKGIYGEAEDIYVVARKGFDQDAPDVASLLNKFFLDDDQLGTLEDYINDGMKPVDAGRKWMEENPEVVANWLE